MHDDEAITYEPHVRVSRCAWNTEIEAWSFYNWLRPGNYAAPLLTLTAPAGDCVQTVRTRSGLRTETGDRSGLLVARPDEVLVVEQLRGRQPRPHERTIVAISIPMRFFEHESLGPLRGGFVPSRGPDVLSERLFRTVVSLEKSDMPRCRREENVLELFHDVARASGAAQQREPPMCSDRVRRAREYIHAHFTDSYGLDDLAGAVGLSKWYVTRMFRRHFGITPGEYTRALRAQRALSLIRSGAPSALAASRAGYADKAHMGREIRALLGITPARYGRLVRRSH